MRTIEETGGAADFVFDYEAANLLYFIVKKHAFSDGNKRIADTPTTAIDCRSF